MQAKETSEGFGLFLRSLAGLERDAAKAALDHFLAGKKPTANQIEFIDLIVTHLSEQGFVEDARLYESPFTDLSPLRVEGIFPPDQVTELLGALNEVRLRAAASRGCLTDGIDATQPQVTRNSDQQAWLNVDRRPGHAHCPRTQHHKGAL